MIVPFYIERTDTVVVKVANSVNVAGPSFWWDVAQIAIPVLAAIVGWYWVNKLDRASQRAHFFHQMMYSTAQAVIAEMEQYERWSVWRTATLSSLLDRGELRKEVAQALAEQLTRPVANQWILLLNGSQFVLSDAVTDFVPTAKALADRHTEISRLSSEVADEANMVKRMAMRDDARDKSFTLGNDVHHFRLKILRQVTEKLKPERSKLGTGILSRTKKNSTA